MDGAACGLDADRLYTDGQRKLCRVKTWGAVELFAVMSPFGEQPSADVLIEPILDPLTGQETVAHDGRYYPFDHVSYGLFSLQFDHALYLRIARPGQLSVVVDLTVTAWRLQQELRAQLARRATVHAAIAGESALEAWIDQTLSLAAETEALVDQQSRALMTSVAENTRRNLAWWRRHFVNDVVDARRLYERRLSLLAWVVDELVAACNTFQPFEIQLTTDRGVVLRRMLCEKVDDHREFSAELWQKRVIRLRSMIRPGLEGKVFADVIESLHPISGDL